MAYTVQSALNFARIHTKLAPLVGLGGFSSEPALAIANDVVDQIITRPYDWYWNRQTIPSWLTVANTDEYISPIERSTDIGWLTRAYRIREDDTATPPFRWPVRVVQSIPRESYSGDPDTVAFDRDENGLNILRIKPIPNSTEWRMFVEYQKKPVLITEVTGNFDPIPDSFAPVIRQFFIAFAMKLVDARRADVEMGAALQLLHKHAQVDDAPEEGIGMVPDRSLFLG